MKYKLISPVNNDYTAIEQVLINRGIERKQIKHYLNTTDDNINSYTAFGLDTLRAGAEALLKCISNNEKAVIIVDCDCDGFTSSAVLLNYLHEFFPAWVETKIRWELHSGKIHGLSDRDLNKWILEDVKLVICPDSASNNYEQHEILYNNNISVLILDHHNAKKISEYAITINNQLCDYPNKDFSGAGVTWQFCKYLDSLLQSNKADDFLDLVALGLDADMMSLRSLETKHLINKGFEEARIINPFISGMNWKNSYSIGPKLTPKGAAWYIAPFVNAISRSGTLEEKELLFKSMLTFEAFKKVPSTKRGHKPGDMEEIDEQAIRICTNVKNRQGKAETSGMLLLENIIQEEHLLEEHKALVFKLEPGQIDSNILGLCCNKISPKYQRPCCALIRCELPEGVFYRGSARGCDIVEVTDFQKICLNTNLVEYAEGHPGAFGLSVAEENLDEFLNQLDNQLKDMSSESCYKVDYIFNNQLDKEVIFEIHDFDNLWGKDIEEPLIAVENVKVSNKNVALLKETTLKITLPDGGTLIKFGSNQEEYESFLSPPRGYKICNFVGYCNKNSFNGVDTPQIKITDYEINSLVKYDF